jgi:nucleotide-binding universal stress UspA family protein
MSAYHRILVAVDGSDASSAGLREALRLAKSEGGELCILHVVNESVPYTPLAGAPPVDLIALMQDSGRRVLDEARKRARKAGVRAKTVLLESADRTPAAGIVSQARKQRADLIVLGTHGRRGVRRLVMGSDAEQVVRTAPAPVLLVRAERRPK